MSYSPAPTKPTRILGPDGVPLTGDVSLTPGNNARVDRAANGLIVTAAPPVQARSLCAFGPGIITARTLQDFQVDNPILNKLDVYCGTAPAGVTGASCGNVRVAGSVLGAVVLPLSSPGVAEYHLGRQDLSTIIAGRHVASAFSEAEFGAIAAKFRVTANCTVFGMDFCTRGAGPNPLNRPDGVTPAVFPVFAGIIAGVDDTTIQTAKCMTPPWLTNAAGQQAFGLDPDISTMFNGERRYVAFPAGAGFNLLAGVDYWVAVCASTPSAGGAQLRMQYGSVTSTYTNIGNYASQSRIWGAGGANYGAASTFANNGGTLITNNADLDVSLYGSVLGTTLAGLITVSYTLTGAPATPGSDVNIRCEF